MSSSRSRTLILRPLLFLVAAVLLVSCTVGRSRSRRDSPLYQDFSTFSATCTKNPAGCAEAFGTSSGLGGVVKATAAVVVGTTVIVQEVVDLAVVAKADQVVKECADLARSEVLIRNFGGKTPTAEDCNQMVRMPTGEQIPRYLWFGREMHRVASDCVRRSLGKILPGRFSVEQRYRFDAQTKKATVVTAAEEAAIMRDGRFGELRETIVPDLVMHKGDPRFVEAVYDFKFPCADLEGWSWREYPNGHPYQGQDQRRVYLDALGQNPAAVVPRLGVMR